MSQVVTSIALFRLSALGDVLMFLPTLRALQASFPKAKLYWIISQPAYELVKNVSGVEFILISKPKTLGDYWRLYRKFSNYKFDVLLAAQASLRTNLIYPLISANQKIGYDPIRSRDGHKWFIDEAIPFRRTHTLKGFMQFAEYLGADVSSVEWRLPLDQDALIWAQQNLSAAKTRSGPWIAINPAASKEERTWALASYIELIGSLQEKYDANIVLIGGPGDFDRHLADKIIAHRNILDLVGKTKLPQLLAIIHLVDLLICPDTGPSHMAAALGKPVVALHAVTRPEISGPYGQLEYVVNFYEEALQRFGLSKVKSQEAAWYEKVHHPEVMQLIKVSDVMNKVEAILNFDSLPDKVCEWYLEESDSQ
jgi:heptosyltransferase I